jgi:Periplasmic protease
LGQRVDLGLEGKKTDDGFLITRIEPRSDSYVQGLRQDDILLSIDESDVKGLSQEEIEAKLNPLINTKVKLAYLAWEDGQRKSVNVLSQEYFKQTVFLRPVAVPGVYCLEIPKFNRTTGEDLFRFLQLVEKQDPLGLVLDLRGNPGGPPLAAREISSFFLKGGDDFAYFQRRNPPDKLDLDVPVINGEYQYQGPIVILVDEGSGSASELFAGVMQFRGRAAVIGTNTAGQVLLKSMFSLMMVLWWL